MNKLLSEYLSAWQIYVRRKDTMWMLFATYDSIRQAELRMDTLNGTPLIVKLVPLYPMKESMP